MVSLDNYSEKLLTYDKPKDALEAYVKIYMQEQSAGMKVIHKNAARKKIIATAIYAVLFFMILSIFAFYREFKLAYGVALLALITVVWLVTSLIVFTSEKSLLHKIKEMPDAEIDSVLASEYDNCRSVFKVYGTGAAIVAVTMFLSVFLYRTPHMVFEKNDTGYGLRYYTRALHEENKVVVPDTYKGEPVTEIRGNVFFGTEALREIGLPKGLREIRGSTFERCANLEKIDIPEGVTRIGGHAFRGCSSLSSMTLPATVQAINGSAFRECTMLEEINLPEGIDRVGDNAFRDCQSLKSVILPSTVVTIGDGAFRDCITLTGVIFADPAAVGNENPPDTGRTVGSTAFRDCASLEEIILPEGYTRIGENAFRDCYRLSHVGIPSTMEYLDRYAFRGCIHLDEIVLPKGCEQGENVFREANTKVIYE